MKSPRQKKNVIVSFRIVNVAGVDTFSGTLRYLRTIANWNIRLHTAQNPLTPEIVNAAAKGGIDGILTDHPLHEELADALLNSEVPLVSIGNSDERLFKRRVNVAFLEMDSRRIGQTGARHFLSLGRYRSYGFLPDIPSTRWSRMRLRGFRDEFQANGITVRVFQTDEPPSGNLYRVRLARWFKALPHPAAVLLAGDYRATEAFEACAQAGLAVPNDVAILGVDNDPVLCDSLSPSLSSVEPPFEKEGFEAARTLDRLMRARKRFRRPLILRFDPVRIVERDSTVSLVPSTHLIDRALEFIAANAAQPISARDVAERLKVSPSLLALRFRQREKTTVRDAIIDARLKKVCALLKDRKMTVARIAARCGFASANRLTRLFTKRFGVSPRGYRNAAAQDL